MIGSSSDVLTDETNPSTGWTLCGEGTDLADYEYREMENSGGENWADDNSQIERTFHCKWEKRDLFMQDLLGQNLLMTNNRISRRTPDQHPNYANFFAVDAKVSGLKLTGKDGYKITYDRAIIQAVYRQLPYWVRTDLACRFGGETQLEYERYCSFAESYDTAFVTDNCGVEGTLTGGSKVNMRTSAQTAKTIPSTSLTITWHKVPSKSESPFRSPTAEVVPLYQGYVNDREFFGYPAETVLFVGADPKQSAATVDIDPLYEIPSITYNIPYKFGIRKYATDGSGWAGWNHVLRCGSWIRATYQNSVTPRYPLANLYDLWTIPS